MELFCQTIYQNSSSSTDRAVHAAKTEKKKDLPVKPSRVKRGQNKTRRSWCRGVAIRLISHLHSVTHPADNSNSSMPSHPSSGPMPRAPTQPTRSRTPSLRRRLHPQRRAGEGRRDGRYRFTHHLHDTTPPPAC
jgi:hypothetical protein